MAFFAILAAARAVIISFASTCSSTSHAFQPGATERFQAGRRLPGRRSPLPAPRGAPGDAEPAAAQPFELSPEVDFPSLTVMDVVLFQRRRRSDDDGPLGRRGAAALELGAVQENGNVAPLSAWTPEPAYGDAMGFVVDEEDLVPGLSREEVRVVKVLDGVDYGSRQVGGGKGPGNPHGEESELLYYVDRGVVDGTYSYRDERGGGGGGKSGVMTIDVVVNPDLEHLW